MHSEITHKIMYSIQQQWDIFEDYLYYPTKIAGFHEYLNNYRGIQNIQQVSFYKKNEIAQNALHGIINFFINIFSIQGLANFETQGIECVLAGIEKNINLSLYYWFGLNDRNYQFRTWIHYFGLDGLSAVFLTKDKIDFSITLTENGICFGKFSENRPAQILPISVPLIFEQGKKLGLNGNNERIIFARLRTIQREVCLIIEEWEYQNSILAVEYGHLLESLQRNKNNFAEDPIPAMFKKMDLRRNFLAQWVLCSLCDFQVWVNQLGDVICLDLKEEIDALCALMLSALQKIFLPASISRLVYNNEVITLFQSFIKARLEYCPEDFSAKLLLQTTESAQGKDFNSELFYILKAKPFEWKLCFDPSPALKAFSWAYSKQHHALLCSVMGLCYFKKCYSDRMEDFQFCDLVSTYQIQESFLLYLKREPIFENPLTVSEENTSTLLNILNNYFKTYIKPSPLNKEYLHLISNYIGCLSKI